jgi:ferric-dicitrate binding protein FerR (iron transport regulator)
VESRDQLVARRRAAQRAWRSASERAERAAQYLREALTAPNRLAATVARQRLEHAQRAERQARASYYLVAEETGALLSGLERTGAGIV